MRFWSTSWLLVCGVAASGCFISENSLTGQPCAQDSDCPSTHHCVSLGNAAPSGEERVCEVLYPPVSQGGAEDAGTADAGRPGASGDGGSDAGSQSGPDAGRPDAGALLTPTWCRDIQPVMAANCVSSCHGQTTTGSGRTDFRLDVYSSATSPVGAREKAARIKARAVDARTMPPTNRTPLSAADRDLLDRWIDAGTPQCTDAGTP